MTASVILEHDAAFSESRLWQLQRDYYQRGVQSWSNDAVPHYITTNPTSAAAFARVIEGWLRDGALVDRAAPLTVLELGAGTGRMGWHLVRCLDELQARGLVPRFRYVLSDVSQASLAWWRDHPQLAPLLARGVMDVALVDAEASGTAAPIELEVSGERLEALANPLVVIATYLFDSLRCDAFAVRGGAVFEKRLTLAVPAGAPAPGDPEQLVSSEQTWRLVPVAAGRYPEPELDALLGSYAALDGDAELTFPIAGLRCLRRLERAAGGRMLVLASDKGFVEPAAMRGRSEPDITTHGSVSLPVNFHAIIEDARRRGAVALTTRPTLTRLACVAVVHGAARHDETRAAFREAVVRAGPDDWYALKKAFERRFHDASLEELLALLRWGRGDDNVMRSAASTLFERIAAASPGQRDELDAVLATVERSYFWVGEAADLPFLVGIARHLAGDEAGAGASFRRALALFERAPRPCHRLVLGGMWIGDADGPGGDRVRALEADPGYVEARAKLLTIAPDDPVWKRQFPGER